MRIIVIGAGAVGFNLARRLAEEKQDVVVVERNDSVVKRISEKLDVLCITGDGASPRILEKAGIRDAELVIAVTDSDERNMIVCLLARNYGVKTRLARIRNPEFTGEDSTLTRRQLAVDHIIDPETLSAQAVSELVLTPGAAEVAHFSDENVLMMGFEVPKGAPIAGKNLASVREIASGEFVIVAVRRDGKTIIPRGQEVLQEGDLFYVLMATALQEFFLGLMFRRIQKVRKAIIYGAGRVGRLTAQRLVKEVNEVIVIDSELKRCKRAASALEGVQVLHGGGTEPDFLEELRLEESDAFLALSDNDSANITAALLAKEQGAGKAFPLVGTPEFVPLAGRVGLDAAINPHLQAVGDILRVLRARNILSVIPLEEMEAEVMELVASPDSAVVDKSLIQLAEVFPEGALVGAVLHESHMELARGDTIIRAGDRVIVFAREHLAKQVNKLFQKVEE